MFLTLLLTVFRNPLLLLLNKAEPTQLYLKLTQKDDSNKPQLQQDGKDIKNIIQYERNDTKVLQQSGKTDVLVKQLDQPDHIRSEKVVDSFFYKNGLFRK